MTGHLTPCEVMEQAMLEVISRHVKDMQFLLSPFRLHSQQQHLVYLEAAPPHSSCRALGSKPGVQKPTNNKLSNQHQTSFLLFKAGLSTKNHAEEVVFSSKHSQCSPSNKPGNNLLPIHRSCLEQEPGLL